MNYKYIAVALVVGLLSGYFLAQQTLPESVVVANDRDYFPMAYSLIMSANSSVHVLMFEAKYYKSNPDSLSNKLLEALADKSRTADVVVYVDSLFNVSRTGYDYLKSRNVTVFYGIPGKVAHSKLVIVDGKYVLIGSSNWGYYALSRNHETNVLIKSGPIASQFEKYFRHVVSEAELGNQNTTVSS